MGYAGEDVEFRQCSLEDMVVVRASRFRALLKSLPEVVE